jgi:hypothetical protein
MKWNPAIRYPLLAEDAHLPHTMPIGSMRCAVTAEPADLRHRMRFGTVILNHHSPPWEMALVQYVKQQANSLGRKKKNSRYIANWKLGATGQQMNWNSSPRGIQFLRTRRGKMINISS